MKTLLSTLFLFYSLLAIGQWSSSPYTYGEQETEKNLSQKYEIQQSLTQKRAIASEVPTVFPVAEEEESKKPTEEINSNSKIESVTKAKEKEEAPKKMEISNTTTEADADWEKVKKDFNTKSVETNEQIISQRVSSKKDILKLDVLLFERNFQAESPFYPRKMNFSSIGLGLSGKVRTGKNSGVVVSYESSLNAATKDHSDSSKNTEVELLKIYLGLEWRLESLGNASETYFQFGLMETNLQVPRSADYKLSWKSSGLDLAFGSRYHLQEAAYGFKFGVQLANSHTETISSWTAKSGTSPKSQGAYLNLFFDSSKEASLTWRYYVEFSKEHILFSGQSEANDPVSGNTVNGNYVNIETKSLGVKLIWNY